MVEAVGRGEGPPPSLKFPYGSLIVQSHRSPYLDTGTDVGFVLC